MTETSEQNNNQLAPSIVPLPVAILLLVAALVVFYLYAWPWLYWYFDPLHPDDLPGLNSHWHAPYSIQVCGDHHPPLPYSEGDVHSHGDGFIHIHPSSPETVGSRATVERFIDSVGGNLTDTRLALPPLLDVENGDRCNNGDTGELSVYVNGRKAESPTSVVPEDGDQIIIYFGKPLPPMERPEFPTRSTTESDTA